MADDDPTGLLLESGADLLSAEDGRTLLTETSPVASGLMLESNTDLLEAENGRTLLLESPQDSMLLEDGTGFLMVDGSQYATSDALVAATTTEELPPPGIRALSQPRVIPFASLLFAFRGQPLANLESPAARAWQSRPQSAPARAASVAFWVAASLGGLLGERMPAGAGHQAQPIPPVRLTHSVPAVGVPPAEIVVATRPSDGLQSQPRDPRFTYVSSRFFARGPGLAAPLPPPRTTLSDARPPQRAVPSSYGALVSTTTFVGITLPSGVQRTELLPRPFRGAQDAFQSQLGRIPPPDVVPEYLTGGRQLLSEPPKVPARPATSATTLTLPPPPSAVVAEYLGGRQLVSEPPKLARRAAASAFVLALPVPPPDVVAPDPVSGRQLLVTPTLARHAVRRWFAIGPGTAQTPPVVELGLSSPGRPLARATRAATDAYGAIGRPPVPDVVPEYLANRQLLAEPPKLARRSATTSYIVAVPVPTADAPPEFLGHRLSLSEPPKTPRRPAVTALTVALPVPPADVVPEYLNGSRRLLSEPPKVAPRPAATAFVFPAPIPPPDPQALPEGKRAISERLLLAGRAAAWERPVLVPEEYIAHRRVLSEPPKVAPRAAAIAYVLVAPVPGPSPEALPTGTVLSAYGRAAVPGNGPTHIFPAVPPDQVSVRLIRLTAEVVRIPTIENSEAGIPSIVDDGWVIGG